MNETEKHLEMLNTLIADGFFALADDGETRTVSAVKWALSEIQRLRAKTNRVIRGYQYFDLCPKTEDLIKEEEI